MVTSTVGCLQELDAEIKGKYATVERLIGTKAVGVADAKKRAQLLQREAQELLLKASEKLRQLKGETPPFQRDSVGTKRCSQPPRLCCFL